MQCDIVSILWKKFFLTIANNRDYVHNYCNKPLNRFDQHCREWYLHNLIKNDIEINSSNSLDDLPEHAIYWEGDDFVGKNERFSK